MLVEMLEEMREAVGQEEMSNRLENAINDLNDELSSFDKERMAYLAVHPY